LYGLRTKPIGREVNIDPRFHSNYARNFASFSSPSLLNLRLSRPHSSSKAPTWRSPSAPASIRKSLAP
jgi:hypothetical protein